MSISNFFDKVIDVQRLSTISGNRKQWVSTMTIDMHIQNASDSEDNEYFAAYSATHKGWADEDSSIREGDRLEDADGNHYEVVNINKKEYVFAMNRHQEVLLRLNNG